MYIAGCVRIIALQKHTEGSDDKARKYHSVHFTQFGVYDDEYDTCKVTLWREFCMLGS